MLRNLQGYRAHRHSLAQIECEILAPKPQNPNKWHKYLNIIIQKIIIQITFKHANKHLITKLSSLVKWNSRNKFSQKDSASFYFVNVGVRQYWQLSWSGLTAKMGFECAGYHEKKQSHYFRGIRIWWWNEIEKWHARARRRVAGEFK